MNEMIEMGWTKWMKAMEWMSETDAGTTTWNDEWNEHGNAMQRMEIEMKWMKRMNETDRTDEWMHDMKRKEMKRMKWVHEWNGMKEWTNG